MFKYFLLIIAYLYICDSYKLDFSDYKLFDLLNNLQQDYEQREVESSIVDHSNFIKFQDTLPLLNIGQVGGLATLKNGNLLVFHRASRKWGFDSFDSKNNFNIQKYGPIDENVIVNVDSETSEIKDEWGKNIFYMPHGLTVDDNQNIWLTDVALHQVIKFENGNYDEPSLVLGVKFENGNDNTHFCKPTDVAISSINGDIFVSDGYCNSRVVQFDKNGNFIKEFTLDNKDKIVVSHSVALIENLNLVCVADRENGRIICFNITSGEVASIIKHENMLRVFAIEYNKETELLHAVSGPANTLRPFGFTFNAAKGSVFGDFLSQWEPPINQFEDPHDITTSLNGRRIYTGELNGRIDEFDLN